MPALMMVAEQVRGLRLGTCVLCNDFRHPVVMAKDAATVDVLSGGRFELGLGAGYQPPEYVMAGIPFESGPGGGAPGAAGPGRPAVPSVREQQPGALKKV